MQIIIKPASEHISRVSQLKLDSVPRCQSDSIHVNRQTMTIAAVQRY